VPAAQSNRDVQLPPSALAGGGHLRARGAAFAEQGDAVRPADGGGAARGAAPFSPIAHEQPSEEQIQTLLEEEDARIEAVYQFNANPRRNIVVLCQHFKREATPGNIAVVLHETPGLLGEKIGEFLVHPDNEIYLKEYFRAIDLHVDFLEALRRSLSGPFFMPGEAQQVERTVQALSEVYIEQNPGIFGDINDAVILGFALIMLNTDLLKPNVTHKMTVDQFISNTMGALTRSSISAEHLTHMYESLRANPFAFAPKSNDFMALCAPKMRGWLKKKSEHFMGSWKAHYFVLANSCLYYFKDDSVESKDNPLGMIQLTEVDVAQDPRSPLRFLITARGEQIQYVKLGGGVPKIVPGLKAIQFEAKEKDGATNWFLRLKRSVVMSSFLDGPGPRPSLTDTGSDQDGAGQT
jgi:hypothetical protein